MKYLIISMYDSSYCWSVATKDEKCDREDYVRGYRIKGLEQLLEQIDSDFINYHDIAMLDYDFIVLCQDGDIEILKE